MRHAARGSKLERLPRQRRPSRAPRLPAPDGRARHPRPPRRRLPAGAPGLGAGRGRELEPHARRRRGRPPAASALRRPRADRPPPRLAALGAHRGGGRHPDQAPCPQPRLEGRGAVGPAPDRARRRARRGDGREPPPRPRAGAARARRRPGRRAGDPRRRHERPLARRGRLLPAARRQHRPDPRSRARAAGGAGRLAAGTAHRGGPPPLRPRAGRGGGRMTPGGSHRNESATARTVFPVLERCAYLNAGTNGPLPRPAVEAAQARLERDLQQGRSGDRYIDEMRELRERVRARFASTLRTRPELVALTDSTTRLVAVSLALWTTGRRLDIARLRRPGAPPLLVDGAQSAGAIPPDLAGADFYTVSAQKWLCAPEPTGALFVRDPERLRVALPGYLSQRRHEPDGAFVPKEGASRFDSGWIGGPTLAGLEAALAVHPPWRYEAAAAATARCRALLEPLVEVLTPADHSTLVSFRPQGDPTGLVAALAERDVVVREIPGRGIVRVSCGWWTSDDDLRRLVDGGAACDRASQAG